MIKIIEFLVEVEATKAPPGHTKRVRWHSNTGGLNQTGKEVLLDSGGKSEPRDTDANVSLIFVLANASLTWGGQNWDVKFPADPDRCTLDFRDQLDKEVLGNEPGMSGLSSTPSTPIADRHGRWQNKHYFIYDYASP